MSTQKSTVELKRKYNQKTAEAKVHRHQPATLRAPGSLPERGRDNERQSASEQHHNQPQGIGLVVYENTVNT